MKTRLTVEHLLYALALVLALFLRLWQLGAAPLSDTEARFALRALDLSRGAALSVDSQPAQEVLSAVLFGLIEPVNGLARVLPALAGSFLVFAPLFFRQRGLSRQASLTLAFGLALDPGLTALSRQVGSIVPAVSFGLLAIGAAYRRQPILAGICGGLALLSGPGILAGALGVLVAFGLGQLLQKAEWLSPLEENDTPAEAAPLWGQNQRRTALLAAGGTLLAVGTAFLAFPQGLAGLANTLSDYLTGWTQLPTLPATRMIVALAAYQPLALVFGLAGAVRAWVQPQPVAQRLSLWLVASLLLALLYPARQVGDLAWALIPLWALATLELSRLLAPAEADRPLIWVAVSQAVFVFVMAVVLRANLLAWQNLLLEAPTLWLLLLGIVLVVVIATALVAVSWSLSLARLGVVWGGCAALFAAQISALWGAAYLRPNSALELWTPSPGVGQTDLFLQTVEMLSQITTGHRDQIEVTLVSTSDQPALRWALRRYPTHLTAQLSKEDQPPIVITAADQTSLNLSASYRGQDFIASEQPGWDGALPSEWLNWLAFRQAPLMKAHVILWARADLFPEGTLTIQDSGSSDQPVNAAPLDEAQP